MAVLQYRKAHRLSVEAVPQKGKKVPYLLLGCGDGRLLALQMRRVDTEFSSTFTEGVVQYDVDTQHPTIGYNGTNAVLVPELYCKGKKVFPVH